MGVIGRLIAWDAASTFPISSMFSIDSWSPICRSSLLLSLSCPWRSSSPLSLSPSSRLLPHAPGGVGGGDGLGAARSGNASQAGGAWQVGVGAGSLHHPLQGIDFHLVGVGVSDLLLGLLLLRVPLGSRALLISSS